MSPGNLPGQLWVKGFRTHIQSILFLGGRWRRRGGGVWKVEAPAVLEVNKQFRFFFPGTRGWCAVVLQMDSATKPHRCFVLSIPSPNGIVFINTVHPLKTQHQHKQKDPEEKLYFSPTLTVVPRRDGQRYRQDTLFLQAVRIKYQPRSHGWNVPLRRRRKSRRRKRRRRALFHEQG